MDIGDIERRFDAAAGSYSEHDALEREIGERLLERTSYARRPPQRIIDLGCGTGRGARALKKRFANARVFGLDLSRRMLDEMSQGTGDSRHLFAVQGDLTRLPFAARAADLVYCNLALQWAGDFTEALKEIRRVLRPEGMLLFSVPGPESLRELRLAPGSGASASMPIYMPDLRDVGDLLVSSGFSEPVMDNEVVMLSYPSVDAMRQELQVTGGAGFADLPALTTVGSGIELSFEIVYGTAFGAPEGRPVRTEQGEIATFSIDRLKRN